MATQKVTLDQLKTKTTQTQPVTQPVIQPTKKETNFGSKLGLLDSVQANSTSAFVSEGMYKVRITSVKHLYSRKGDELGIVEFKVLESQGNERSLKVDQIGAVCYNFKEIEGVAYGLKNLRQFLDCALTSEENDTLSFEDADELEQTSGYQKIFANEESILVGRELKLRAYDKPTKTPGKVFTKTEWLTIS
jgi:hypothetical protein